MLHYDALEALSAVVREKSFARAARALHISQPAVTQRIQLLENSLGRQLLVRESPPRLTELGTRVVQHLLDVRRMERELGVVSDADSAPAQAISIAIGTNSDSLSNWLLESLTNFVRGNDVEIHFAIEDEDYSLELLRRGEVVGTVATQRRAHSGCDVEHLGKLRYHCLANPAFLKKYKSESADVKSLLLHSPCVAFGLKDDMQETFVRRHTGRREVTLRTHYIGASHDYLMAVVNGWGWGLVPEMQAQPFLRSKKLRPLKEGLEAFVDLYWHQWRVKSAVAKRLGETIISEGRRRLVQ